MDVDAVDRVLLAFLEAQRARVFEVVAGLDAEQLSTAALPSGWTPLGMIEHLGHAERHWLHQVALGSADALPWPDDPAEGVDGSPVEGDDGSPVDGSSAESDYGSPVDGGTAKGDDGGPADANPAKSDDGSAVDGGPAKGDDRNPVESNDGGPADGRPVDGGSADGGPVGDDGGTASTRSVELVFGFYRDQIARSNAVLASVPWDSPPVGDHGQGDTALITDLRFVVLHLIEETARHLGHLDAARELIDGATALGQDPL